jgi:radical SAM family uncharacterized protein/radical SAM-linked protein
MRQIDLEPWLPLVAKPSRYIDHEINAVRKPWQDVNLCFAFPEVYEIGVSHLGLKILYSIVNRIPGAMADRCYLPWTDLTDLMRREGIPLFGIESRVPLADFDLIGITLQSEINYSNVLELIDLAGLPVLAKERGKSDPIVMAGGPCATNPLPLAEFIDVFFIGEAEEAISEITSVLMKSKDRDARLSGLAGIEGCYVPSLHGIPPREGVSVKARKFSSFSEGRLIHKPQFLSWQLATHNRHASEIMRGCSRGCRFCHAGYFYRPVRERDADGLLRDIREEIEASGWDEAGLMSLSSSDYGCIRDLLFNLLAVLDTNKTHISLPSLRVDGMDADLIELMRELGREGLTIAPEAGSQRLRDIINKNLNEADILQGVQTALDLGWQKVKLYFMVGLPFETDGDIDELLALIRKIDSLGRRRLTINITLSPFVPKPFTPFQWAPMLAREIILERCRKVKFAFTNRHNLKIKYHDVDSSLLEALFARGDERIGGLLLEAWRRGARFDGWNECFDFGLWEKAMDSVGLDPAPCLADRLPEDRLPWDFIDLGLTKNFLLEEWRKASQTETTPDCREVCSACGVCGPELATVSAPRVERLKLRRVPAPDAEKPASHHRYRVYYAKTGVLRFISHLDWMRMLFRWIGKTDLRTVFTQGFSPHPKASLSPPLPLGVESRIEFFDLAFSRPYSCAEIKAAFNSCPNFGLAVTDCEVLKEKGIQPPGEVVAIALPEQMAGSCQSRIGLFNNLERWNYTKDTGTRSKSYDLKAIITDIGLRGNILRVSKLLASPALFDVLAELLAMEKEKLYQARAERVDWIWKV